MKKNILLISYYYPPLADVGGLRALGFSKHLSKYGWRPHVLTVRNPDPNFCLVGNEISPDGVSVYHSRSLLNLMGLMGKMNGMLARILKLAGKELKRNIFTDMFCIPDIFIGWIPLSILKGLELIRNKEIDVVYVSCKPFSSALIGTCLRKITRKPLIIDMRDPTIPRYVRDRSFSFKFNERALLKIEKHVLRRVDRLIFVTRETEKSYLTSYPFLKGRTDYIYNGFFSEFLPKRLPDEFEKFTIIYIGNFYIDYNGEDLIFKALKKVVSEEIIRRDEINFLYLGHQNHWFMKMRQEYSIADIVVCPGRVKREKAIETLFKAQVIYLRFVDDMISTKLYEGLASGNPLLATTSNQEVIELIYKYSDNSIVTKPGDVEELASAIGMMFIRWKNGNLVQKLNSEYYNAFEKSCLTANFVRIAEGLIK